MKITNPVLARFALLLAAGGSLLPLGHADTRPATAHRAPVQADDTARDGSTVLPNGWHVSPAGRPIALPGDLPLKMAVTAGGRYLLVATGGFHDNDLDVVDLTTQKVVQSVDLAQVWAGLSLDDGGHVYVAAGGPSKPKILQKTMRNGASPETRAALREPIYRLRFADGRLTPQASVAIPGLKNTERWTAGLACGPGGTLYALNSQNDTLYRFAPDATGAMAMTASVRTGYRPYSVALSADGRTLAVSNWGGQSVSLFDPATLAEQARVPVGSHPNELAWSPDGRLFVADAGANSVSVLRGPGVVETIKTSLHPNDPVGATPDALALSPDGKRLYVANADNNDVCVVDVSDDDESGIMGFIPTGWYPSALAVSPDGKNLYVGTGKGLKFRANAPARGAGDPQRVGGGPAFDYIPDVLSGTVSVVPVPDAPRLAAFTRQVLADTPRPARTASVGAARAMSAFRHIKHVVYIIRENRTYDQVFGDIPAGNGDPSLVFFGANVTPNGHALVSRYVLLDNLYCNGEVSQDGHQWCDADYATDFTERAWVTNYSGRGQLKADERLTDSPAGYLWDNCARHGVTYRAYGEASHFTSGPDQAPVFSGPQTLSGHSSAAYAAIPWCAGARDAGRADVFISDLHEGEKNNNWPQFLVLSLPDDHTQGLRAGQFTPSANVAMNDQALGKIVEAVSHSKFWPETALFVIEDDAQNGPDHVDAHRTEGLVISPYLKTRAVVDTMYTTSSFVRTMELILGLPPMTQFDAYATPLFDCFTDRPTLTPFRCLSPRTDLNATNPATGAGADASAKLDWSAPDAADPDRLNAILWHALKPGPVPAPVRSARLMR